MRRDGCVLLAFKPLPGAAQNSSGTSLPSPMQYDFMMQNIKLHYFLSHVSKFDLARVTVDFKCMSSYKCGLLDINSAALVSKIPGCNLILLVKYFRCVSS